MRDVTRRLRVALWGAVAIGVVVTVSPHVVTPRWVTVAGPSGGAAGGSWPVAASHGSAAADQPSPGRPTPGQAISTTPAAAQGRGTGPASGTQAADGQEAGTFIPARKGAPLTVPVAQLISRTRPAVAPLRHLLAADLLVVAPRSLPKNAIQAVRRLAGVTAAESLDAARVKLDGGYVAVLGVDPSRFRPFAAKPTAQSTALWQNVADGGIAVSYLMGKQEKLPLGGTVRVTGVRTETLRVGGFGTVGISGVDAVVSDSVARSLGMPAGNAIVVSAPHAQLSELTRELERVLPHDASVAPLVAQAAVRGLPVTTGSAGGIGVTASDGPGLTAAQTRAFLVAAESRLGLPYVWGGSGPEVFDCSGLVQWSMRQAGIVMPRVAVDQAQTGPRIPLSDLQPGDLLFYHTDPTAPTYISHVAIYLGNGMMEQAPQPGMDVQVVPAVFDGGFAGAVRVYPRVAAAVAAEFSG